METDNDDNLWAAGLEDTLIIKSTPVKDVQWGFELYQPLALQPEKQATEQWLKSA